MMIKNFNIDESRIKKAQEELNVSPFIAEILLQRDINTKEKLDKFINVSYDDIEDPFNYTGMEDAVNRIKQAVNNHERVVVYGDYDCDGVCAVSILYTFLKEHGVEVFYYIPNRTDEGYGLHIESLETIAERVLPDLVITVDCGISSKEEVEYAIEALGMDIIITDHHELPDILPECIVVDPKIDKETAFADICGAAVALRLVEALSSKEYAKQFLDIVAIATIADVVPLVKDNRILAKLGMQEMSKRKRIGLSQLLDSCSIKDEVTTYDIGFKIRPRINALGRLSNADDAVNLFISNDAFITKKIVQILNDMNVERQKLTDDLYEYCKEIIIDKNMVNDKIIVLYNKYWQAGILGIVAAKIARDMNRPCIVLTEEDGLLHGSGRSIDGISIYNVVKHAIDYLESFGGHEMACGLTLKESNFEKFKSKCEEYIENVYSDNVYIKPITYDMVYDYNVSMDDVIFLKKLEPYGIGNKKPVFLFERDAGNFKKLGQTMHIKEEENDRMNLAFGYLPNLRILNQDLKRSYIGTLALNIFNNKISAQFTISSVHIQYEGNEDKILNDRLIAQYIVGLLKIDEERRNVTILNNFDEAINLSNDEIFGTCYIALFKDTYEKFNEKMKSTKNNIIRSTLNLLDTDIPYNRLLFDPIGLLDLKKYNKIVFLDMPISINSYTNLDISKKASIFTIKAQNDIIIAKIAESMPSMDDYREIYLLIKKILKEENVYSISSLNDRISAISDFKQIKVYIVIYTLMDLSLMKNSSDIGLFLNEKTKVNLDDSLFRKRIQDYIS